MLTAQTPHRKQHRTTISLNGQWEVGESVEAEPIPTEFGHSAPVPGLTHSAVPAFPDVDQYQSRELLANLVQQGEYPKAAYLKLGNARGISLQTRNYFWYRRQFRAPSPTSVALLRIGKAQFSTVLYLNGVRIGEHDPCFTAAVFDVTRAIHWNAANVVVIRIGALPKNVSEGTDFEKNRWTPGIYDDVSLMTMADPVISSVQVAPQLANPGNPVASALVQTELQNYSDHTITTPVQQEIVERLSGRPASRRVTTIRVHGLHWHSRVGVDTAAEP